MLVVTILLATAMVQDTEGPDLLRMRAINHFKEKEYEKVIVYLDRLARKYPKTHGGLASVGKGEVLLKLGWETDALRAFEKAMAFPSVNTRTSIMDSSNTRNRAFKHAARLYEKRGEWRKALETYQAWEPESWCGNGQLALDHERDRAIARCRFNLGDVDGALSTLLKRLEAKNPLGGLSPQTALAYAEYAARAGRLDEARERIEALADGRKRERYRVAIRLLDGFVKRQPYLMIESIEGFKAVSPGAARLDGPAEILAAARLLGELGTRSVALLSSGIQRGDRKIITLAALSGLDELVPVFEKQIRSPLIDPVMRDGLKAALRELRRR